MEIQKERIIYEIIDVPETTRVKFYTSVDEGSFIPNHWHSAIEIIYMLEGELTVAVETGIRQLQAGECILINPNVRHWTKCTSPNKAILFQIPMEFMKAYIPEVEQLVFVLDEDTEHPVRRTKINIFKETLEQMRVVNEIRPDGYLLRFNSLLFEVVFQLYHNFSVKVFQAAPKQKIKERERLQSILDYIEKNYDRPISIEEIAGIACLQSGYFCRFFKKYMGTTFLEYQNELRLSYIYRDLINTAEPIHKILENHGFTNYKLFRRVFFEHFGDTPLHIRKNRNKRTSVEEKPFNLTRLPSDTPAGML